MKLIVCTLLLLNVQLALTYKVAALNYVLDTIEFLASEYFGVFSCVFYDISRRDPYNNILNQVLQSPRLSHVVKYVLNSSYQEEFYEQMPFHPTMLLIYPGNEIGHLERNDTIWNMTYTMKLFDPTTKVVVLVGPNRRVAKAMEDQIYWIRFASSAIMNILTMGVTLCNGVYCADLPQVPHPRYLFTLYAREMIGRKITFILNEQAIPGYWNHKWVDETARYLQTDAVELPHNCVGTGAEFKECMKRYKLDSYAADILLASFAVNRTRNFQEIYTGIPWFMKIAVPRDRPLNAVELILMPFTWHVWILLMIILALSEFVKRLFPKLFKNDPILLVVCGFERHNLHRAGLWEKTIFISLIIMMFFVSSAFETKIVSMMVSKPSIQRIKTLDDIVNSDVKFYADIEQCPELALNPVVGKLLVQAKQEMMYETIPNSAHMMETGWIELLNELSFDFERMQPFYVVLDDEYYGGNEMYLAKFRSPLREVFRFVHRNLVEAGLMNLWKRQWREEEIEWFSGRRIKMYLEDKRDLDFQDMEPAWIVLAVGLGVSGVVFSGEYFKRRVDTWWVVHNINFLA